MKGRSVLRDGREDHERRGAVLKQQALPIAPTEPASTCLRVIDLKKLFGMVCDVAGRHRPHLGDHVFRKVLDSLARPGTSEELLNLLFFDTLAFGLIRRLGCGFRLLVEAFFFRAFRGIFCPLALFFFEDCLTLCFLAFGLCLPLGSYPGTFGFLGDFCLFREAGFFCLSQRLGPLPRPDAQMPGR